jgi:carbon storage regulator
MLVLSRKIGERLVIGEGIVVQILAVRRGQIRLGIIAPPSVHIRREELPQLPEKADELQARFVAGRRAGASSRRPVLAR